jgi:hypothetical protein
MTFEEKKYEIVRGALTPELVEFIKISFSIHETANYYTNPRTNSNPYPFGDMQARNSFAWYSALHGESLLRYLKPLVSKVTKKNLVETYSFLRTYYTGGILEKHVDRPSCEYSATICIEKGENHPWPIYIQTLDGEVNKVELEPGDLIVYKGEILPHWRDPYDGNYHRQVFVHYVDADGKFAHTNEYDGRPCLGMSSDVKIRQIQ